MLMYFLIPGDKSHTWELIILFSNLIPFHSISIDEILAHILNLNYRTFVLA